MKEILLSQNKIALVDDEDYEFLNQWKWSFMGKRTSSAVRASYINGRNSPIRLQMHRVLMEYLGYEIEKLQIDHINGNPLDNRRENLRVVTNTQNQMNRHVVTSNSGYKGVSWVKSRQKWVAKIKLSSGNKHLGYFKSSQEAAQAYNTAASLYFGEYAALNKL